MSERKVKWTPQQALAIKQRGSDILVSASAGTGKTSVLSGRYVDLVSDKTSCPSVNNILVLTFTEAAAEEMRVKIADRLKDAYSRNGDSHLRSQILQLGGADISTIHSFCRRIISEYFYEPGLDPAFGVIDADEQNLIKAEVLGKTIEWAWQQPNIAAGLSQLLYGRALTTKDDFLTKIRKVSDFLETVILPSGWFGKAELLADTLNPFDGDLGKKQKEILTDKLESILNQMLHAQKVYREQETGGDWDSKLTATHITPVRECLELLKKGRWNELTEVIINFEKPKTNTPKELEDSIASLVKDTAKYAIDSFAGLAKMMIFSPRYLGELGKSVSLQTKVLIELVRKFGQFYSQAKRAINCLDFADLEHYALEILRDKNSQGDILNPSTTALALRQRYKYIFVDEYQDINPVQEAILYLLTTNGTVFVVGDVKQSIYAFRGTEPEIFVKHLKPASIDPQNAPKGLRVDLNENFRSEKPILDFVNLLFGKIMTEQLAGVDYDESAKLHPAAKTEKPVSAGPLVELVIVDRDNFESPSSGVYSKRQYQAQLVAQRIRKMVGADTGKAEFQIFDKQENRSRDVDYRDITILMRSPAQRVDDYIEILRLSGVPVNSAISSGYLATSEMNDMLCLLKTIDNCRRDIELASILRSPFFNVSDSDLAKIKIHGRGKENRRDFYDNVVEYISTGSEKIFADRLSEILCQINYWRNAAQQASLADLIWQIYQHSKYISFVCALPNGRQRKANLLKLHDRAIQFESFASTAGTASLGRFIEFIEKLQESGGEWSAAEPAGNSQNAVRIMSVHKSKGLEFPVVILAELNSEFNTRDLYQDCLTDSDFGIGLQIYERGSNRKLNSVAHEIIAEKKLSLALAEEMRVLYVAATRARERLILVAAQNKEKCVKAAQSGFFFGDSSIPAWQMRSCSSHLEWILYGLSGEKMMHEILDSGLAGKCKDSGLFTFNFYDGEQLEHLFEQIESSKKGKSCQGKSSTIASAKEVDNSLAVLKQSLLWKYPFEKICSIRAKNSVSALTHPSDEYHKSDYLGSLAKRPRILEQAGLGEQFDNLLLGTASHLVISKLDLSMPITTDTVKQTVQRLLCDGLITQNISEHINCSAIAGFFNTNLGRLAFDKQNSVMREWQFSLAMPPEEVADEVVIVQGIIDMVIRSPEGIYVIDFKTDAIQKSQAACRAEIYRGQLDLYAKAAQTILKAKAVQKWLYFLSPECEFEIK